MSARRRSLNIPDPSTSLSFDDSADEQYASFEDEQVGRVDAPANASKGGRILQLPRIAVGESAHDGREQRVDGGDEGPGFEPEDGTVREDSGYGRRASREGRAGREGREGREGRTDRAARSGREGRAGRENRADREGRAGRSAEAAHQPRQSRRSRQDAPRSDRRSPQRASRRSPAQQDAELESTSIGEIRRSTERAARRERLQKAHRRYTRRIVIVVAVLAALVVGWFVLRSSNAFAITDVRVSGVTHLTSDEMAQMAAVPADTTLLRVDTDIIRKRLLQNAWVQDAQVNRVFPNTLEIVVTERSIGAVVEIQKASGSGAKSWAISPDHIWLMPIPEPGTEAAKTTSPQIYEDADAALHITDVPYGTEAEIGTECVDANVNNALDILSGLTTDLSSMVTSVSAAGPVETTLMLNNGVEVAFGKAENIRDKERVILKIMEDNPDGVAYINVRIVENPTWREV